MKDHDYEKLFKLWYLFVLTVSILSGICMVIGLLIKNETLTYMPFLAGAIIGFASYMRDFIARHTHRDS